MADNSKEQQHEPPPAYSFPTDSSSVLSRPNQFKHRAETANLVNNRKHRREYSDPKPTAIIRPRINSRLRHGLKPEFDSWETIFWDKQRKELTIQSTSLPSQRLLAPQQDVTSPSSRRMTNWCDQVSCNIAFCTSIPYFFPFPRTPNQNSSSFQRVELSRYIERSNLRKDATS